MDSDDMGNAADSLHAVIAGCRAELASLYAEVAADGAKKMRRWQDESPMLESYIQAMTGTRQILHRETKQMTAEIANLKAFLDKKAAAEAAQQDPALAGSDVANLREHLSDLQSKLADLDQQLTKLVAQLAGGPAVQAAVRPEERSIYETKLVVLQDTRRLLQSEAAVVSAELKRRESAARLESDKHSAAELGLSDLGRLTEQLAATEAKLDRAKVDSYFPKVKGFRFSGGGNGVYFACKDLHLCEVSAAFSLELEALPAQQQQQQVRLKVTLSGISSSASGQEFKQQQHAHEQQQQAKAAARANTLKRMQPPQQQPAPLYRSGSSSTSQSAAQQLPPATGTAAAAAAASNHGSQGIQQLSPTNQSAVSSAAAAAGGGGMPPQANGTAAAAAARVAGGIFRQSGSSSSSRRSAAVAQFIGKLSDKRDSLKQAIKAASDDRATDRPTAQDMLRDGQSQLPGFSRLAGAFGDKAAAFGERVSHHTGPMGSTSAADSSSDLAGLALPALVETPAGNISRAASGAAAAAAAAAAVRNELASSDALQGAAAAAAAAAAAGDAGDVTPQPGGAGTSGVSAAAQAAAAAANPGGVGRSSSNASSASGRRLSAEFAASSPGQAGRQGSGAMAGRFAAGGGSSPGSSVGQEHDGQLKARLQGMKGRLGGLLTDSKQKLADSKQKLQQSKLLNESKAAAKHMLADSKVLLEESKAGLKTKLADSKILIEEGKVGFKTKLHNIGSKLDEHLRQQQHAEQQQAQQQWEQYQLLQQQQVMQQHMQQQQQQPMQQPVAELQPSAPTPAPTPATAAAAASVQAAEAPSAAVSIVAEAAEQQQQQQDLQAQDRASCDAALSEQQPLSLLSPLSSSSTQPVVHAATGSSADAAAARAAADTNGAAAEAAENVAIGPAIYASAASAAASAASVPESQASLEAAANPFPGVAAAAAAAASTGDLDKQLLDESWVRDEDGGVGGLERGGSGSAAAAAGGAAAAAAAGSTSGGVAGAKGSAGRRGVVVMLLAEGLEVIGEKGTKVPNIRAAQLGLEVEACLSATLTYSSLLGWQSAGLSFEVLSLERQVQGSNLPLPKTLIKSLLNVVMPSVFTKLLLTSLPHELGKFILDSSAAAAVGSSGSSSSSKPGPAGLWLAGEVSLAGPPAACLSANLTRTSGDIPKGKTDIRDFVKELRIAQKARALLDLPEPRHAKALALLLNPGPYSLLPGPAGFNNSPGQGSATTPAAAAAAAVLGPNPGAASINGSSVTRLNSSSGSVATLGGLSVTLNDLCRFFLAYSDSAAWGRICGVWQAALDAVCLQLAREEGLAAAADADTADQQIDGSAAAAANSNCSSVSDATSINSSSSCSTAASFDFAQLMSGRVAGLVRKPVRLSCGLRQLLLSLDVGAGLAAARDYCERAAKEFAENAKGEDALLLLQRPLSMQLELLHLWHAALSVQLTAFAHQFRGAGGRLLLAADRAGFSVAAEGCSYEGPLRLEVPLPLLADLAAGACVWDLALPDPRSAVPTLASKIRFVAAALAKAAFGTCEDEQEALREAAAAEALAANMAAGDGRHSMEVPATQASELEALVAAWSQQALQQQQQQPGKAAGSSTGLLLRHGSLPGSNSSSVAPVLSAQAGDHAPQPAEAAAAIRAGGVASGGSIGRVSLSRLSLGLVLDEKRLQELLAGGIKDANLVGGLLGCFGQLFTANIAPGWQKSGTSADSLSRSSSSASAAAAAGVAATSGSVSADAHSSNGAAGKQRNDQQEPCGMLTVKNNDITRVRAELESASFVSAVAPRIAVRLLHIVALAVVLKFFGGDSSSSSKRLEYVNKVFGHIAEYLGRDCLDLLLCLDVAAAATEAGSLQVNVQGISPAAAAAASNSSSSAAAAAGGSAAGGGAGGGTSPSWPVYVINDVNLLTVLDTVKLIMDYST